MQFMVLSRRRTEQYADADFDAVIPAETERVRQLYADGLVRQIWLRDDVPGACFLVEAPDEATAQATVDALPMATAGLSEFTVLPLKPYRGFGPR
jgi:muconolactone delta-isomerase